MGRVERTDGTFLEASGLDDVAMSDRIAVGDGGTAWVTALERGRVGAAMLSGAAQVGDRVRGLGPLVVPCGREGVPRRIFGRPIPITRRASPTKRVVTGVKTLELFYPMMAGERLLLAGPPSPARSSLVATFTRAQIGPRFYVAYTSEPPEGVTAIRARGGSPAQRVLALSTAMAMAEAARDEGLDAFVVVDDLSAWRVAARELDARASAAELFSRLGAAMDRAGAFVSGSITVVAADDFDAKEWTLFHSAFIFDRAVSVLSHGPEIPRQTSKYLPAAALRGLVPAGGVMRLDLVRAEEIRHFLGPFTDRVTTAVRHRAERLHHLLEQRPGVPADPSAFVTLVAVYTTEIVDALPLSVLADFDRALLERTGEAGLAISAHARPDDEHLRKLRALAKEVAASYSSAATATQ